MSFSESSTHSLRSIILADEASFGVVLTATRPIQAACPVWKFGSTNTKRCQVLCIPEVLWNWSPQSTFGDQYPV